jgi:hypothetical protein
MNEHPLWLDALEKMIGIFTGPSQPETRAGTISTV